MKFSRILSATAIAAFAVSGLSACGGDSRPSEDELSKAIQSSSEDQDVPKEGADCVAKVLHGSKVSDEGLQKMIEAAEKDAEEPKLSAEDEKVLDSEELSGEAMECIMGSMDEGETSDAAAPEAPVEGDQETP